MPGLGTVVCLYQLRSRREYTTHTTSAGRLRFLYFLPWFE